MNISVEKALVTDFSSEAVVACHFEDSKTLEGTALLLDKSGNGLISELIENGDFEGKLFQSAVLYSRGLLNSKRILIMGLGKKKEFSLDKLRGVYSKAAQRIRDLKITEFATSLNFGDIALPVNKLTESVVEGARLGLYRYTPYKTIDKDKEFEIDKFVIVEDNADVMGEIKKSVRIAEILSEAVCYSRDLVSAPSNEMTPSMLAERAKDIFENDILKIEILGEPALNTLRMNALLNVAKGSEEEARLIIIEYNGAGEGKTPIVLVGKGITFDSGGISLKPSDKMDEMKSDMAGGAAVMGAIKAAAELNIPLNIVGLVPAAENLPSGKAYKPGDILRSMSGKTIEVKNTDAEGRLILADALTYAGKYNPEAIIDVATLTGACIIALGNNITGMVGTDKELKEMLKKAGEATGEPVWELPLWDEYNDLIKSDVADIKNTGGREGGVITAALFLHNFVNGHPWVHLDIAGPALLTKDRPYIPKGGSGVGVRLLVQFLRDRAGKDGR